MGSIARTQFGCTKTVTLTAAQIIAASVAPFVLVPAIAGKWILPLLTLVRIAWVADFSSLDAGGSFFVGTDNSDFVNTFFGNLAFFAPGESAVIQSTIPAAGSTTVKASGMTYPVGVDLVFSIDNNGAGPIAGGAGSVVSVETHYVVL